MRLFKKHRVEEINLEIKAPRSKEPNKDIPMYSEAINYFELSSYAATEDLDQKYNIINNDILQSKRKKEEMMHSYYLCKIFSKIASKDREFNLLLMAIEKYINRLRRDEEDLNRKIKNLKKAELNEEVLDDIYVQVDSLVNFQKEINDKISELRLRYFNHLKIATVNATMNKSNTELDNMYKNLNLLLDDFKSLNEAAEYIFFNSGQLIISMVNSLMQCFKDFGKQEYINLYNFRYFLATDVIITLSLKEWIDLYNKIKFVMKITNDADLVNYLEFKNNFIQFELRYVILMMNMEGRKNSNIADFSI